MAFLGLRPPSSPPNIVFPEQLVPLSRTSPSSFLPHHQFHKKTSARRTRAPTLWCLLFGSLRCPIASEPTRAEERRDDKGELGPWEEKPGSLNWHGRYRYTKPIPCLYVSDSRCFLAPSILIDRT